MRCVCPRDPPAVRCGHPFAIAFLAEKRRRRRLLLLLAQIAAAHRGYPFDTMLYAAESSLSRAGSDSGHDGELQSTRAAEALLANELAALRLATPTQRLADKQKLLHFMDAKVR
jgi:hypothetical protein